MKKNYRIIWTWDWYRVEKKKMFLWIIPERHIIRFWCSSIEEAKDYIERDKTQVEKPTIYID